MYSEMVIVVYTRYVIIVPNMNTSIKRMKVQEEFALRAIDRF